MLSADESNADDDEAMSWRVFRLRFEASGFWVIKEAILGSSLRGGTPSREIDDASSRVRFVFSS